MSRPLQSRGHLSQVERLTLTPGRFSLAFRLELQHQLTWFSDIQGLNQNYIVSTLASSSVQCRCLSCHVRLHICWAPSCISHLRGELFMQSQVLLVLGAQLWETVQPPVDRWDTELFQRVEQDWKQCADSLVALCLLRDVLPLCNLASAMIKSLRWQTHGVEGSE